MRRRRFLAIAAAATALPGLADAPPHRWRGRALGADAEIEIRGPKDAAREAFAAIEKLLRETEAAFNLFDANSEISRLNRIGEVVVSERFLAVMHHCDRLHRATNGAFDPTVQPVWRALFEGRPPPTETIGWHRLRIEGRHVRLDSGQALTFNGVAQGYATDQAADLIKSLGYREVLVNIGEYAVRGQPRRIGMSDPAYGYLGTRTLEDAAIATSSPGAMQLGESGHILNPRGGAVFWSTVSVEARSAALADGLSTALCLVPREEIPGIREALPGVGRITLVDLDGNLRTE